MSEQQQGPEVGAAPEGAVTSDPFWSVVRRRHPDVDVVVLPPVPGTRTAPDAATADVAAEETVADEAVDPEAVARLEHEVVRRAWASLITSAGAVEGVSPVVTGRWLNGSAPDRIRREAVAVVEDPSRLADPVAASGLLRRAEETLSTQGWHVLVPPDGLPRLMAGRPEGDGRRELMIVHAPAQGRLLLRVRTADVVVGRAVAHECVVSGG